MVSGEGRIASHSLDVPGVLQVHLEAVKIRLCQTL
jgi:hypothetical protein